MQIIKNIFKNKRVKSFIWRSGMMFVAGLLTVIATSLTDVGFSGQTVVILGLVLGEISKAITNFAKENGVV